MEPMQRAWAGEHGLSDAAHAEPRFDAIIRRALETR